MIFLVLKIIISKDLSLFYFINKHPNDFLFDCLWLQIEGSTSPISNFYRYNLDYKQTSLIYFFEPSWVPLNSNNRSY